MTITRRVVLRGAALVVGLAGFTDAVRAAVMTQSAPAVDLNGAQCDALFLHDGGAAGLAFARQMRVSLNVRACARAVRLLTLDGFVAAGNMLDGARGKKILALLNDAEAVVLDALLDARSPVSRVRRRYGGQVLLSARLSAPPRRTSKGDIND